MALARYQHTVSRLRAKHGQGDRGGAVRLELRFDGDAGADVLDDGRGILPPWIVTGDDQVIGVFAGDTSHHRSLLPVAIAAVQAPLRVGTQRHQRLGQGVGCVRVIDDQLDSSFIRHILHAAVDAGQPRHLLQSLRQGHTGETGCTDRRQKV